MEKTDNLENSIWQNPQSTLIIILNNVEFSRDFNYFLSLELEKLGEKKRTEVSGYFSKPIFKKNKFYFPLPNYSIENVGNLIITAFIATDKENTSIEVRGKAKILGECIVDLKNYKNSLTNISENGLFIPLKFLREKNIVGKFFASIKLVGEDIIQQMGKEEKEPDFIIPQFEMNLLPKSCVDSNISYQVRLNFFSGMFLFNQHRKDSISFPSLQCEFFLMKNEEKINQEMTKVQYNTENPVFNKQVVFLIKENNLENFKILLKISDVNNEVFCEKVSFDLKFLRNFVPLNLEVFSEKFKNESKARYFLSIVLEEVQENNLDLVVKNFTIDPELEIEGLDRYIFAVNFYGRKIENIFTPIQIKSESLDEAELKKITEKNEQNPIFLMTLLNYPHLQIETFYGGIGYLNLPQILFQNHPSIHLLVKIQVNEEIKFDEKNAENSFINLMKLTTSFKGEINIQISPLLDKGVISVINLYEEKDEKNKMDAKLESLLENRNLSTTLFVKRPKIFQEDKEKEEKENVEENKKTEKNKFKKEILSEKEMQLLSDNLKTVLLISDEKEKWEILSKEISQKQDIVSKLMLEYKEKSDILKNTINQISELKKQTVLLEKENSRLKKKIEIEDGIETKNTLKSELIDMDENELRIKLIRVVQSYKEERMRNHQFEKSLQKAHQDLLEIQEIQKEYDELSVEHLKRNKMLLKMQNDISKQAQYMSTIKKQEIVIKKLQSNLEKCILKNEGYQEVISNIAKIEKENEELKEDIRKETEKVVGFESVEVIETEVKKLEKIKAQLIEDLKYKNPLKIEVVEINNNHLELEVEIEKFKKRISALENQILLNSQKQAAEIINLQTKIAEKEYS